MLRSEIAASAVVDLRVDANRDGFVDRRAAKISDDVALKNDARTDRGALMLPNLDDDSRRCPKVPAPRPDGTSTVDMAPYGRCNDSADEVVNGSADEADLATIAALPMPGISSSANAKVTVSKGTAKVRVFVKHPRGWVVLPPSGAVPTELIRVGLEMAVEAKDVRRPGGWDGLARITLMVGTEGRHSEDHVTLRVAPVMMTHHRQTATRLWFPQGDKSDPKDAKYVYGRDILQQVKAARTAIQPLPVSGDKVQFVQDQTEPLTVSMPRGNTMQSMTLLPFEKQEKASGATGYFMNLWRGPDSAYLELPKYQERNIHLAMGGNIEAIPPYTSPQGVRWPHGRLLMGRHDMDGRVENPDPQFPSLIAAQGVQGPPLYANVAWLTVGHIDEVVSFVPAATPRGWKMVIADQRQGDVLAKKALASGEKWLGPDPTERNKLAEYFGPVERRHVAMVIQEIDRIEKLLVQEIGLLPHEIVRVPVLMGIRGGDLKAIEPAQMLPTRRNTAKISARLPNAVNSQLFSDKHVLVPIQFGPRINGKDIFMDAVSQAYRSAGLVVAPIDDRFVAWMGDGDVHCSTSVWRQPTRWWTLR